MTEEQLARLGVFHIEEAILEVLFKDEYINRDEIAQKCGLWRSWGPTSPEESSKWIVHCTLHKLEADGRVELKPDRTKGKTYEYKLTPPERDRRTNKEKGKVDASEIEPIGEGNESVYLYYFPAFKQLAESEGLDHWRCNIGYTIDSAEERVASQIGNQLPERVILALVIQTDDGKALEKRIHAELKERGRWISGDDVVGREWFSTNPDEVERIYLECQ